MLALEKKEMERLMQQPKSCPEDVLFPAECGWEYIMQLVKRGFIVQIDAETFSKQAAFSVAKRHGIRIKTWKHSRLSIYCVLRRDITWRELEAR